MRFSLAAVVSVLSFSFAFAQPKRPNIIVILSDDMGFSDLGCMGGEIATPNLDALAAGGVRFTQFYNTARCCPTRASLLTGLHPHQAGVGHMTEDKGLPGYRGDLNRRMPHDRRGAASRPDTAATRSANGTSPATPQPTARRTTGRSPAASTASTAPSTARGSYLRPVFARPRQHHDLRLSPTRNTSRKTYLLHRRHLRTRRPVRRRSRPGACASSRSSCTWPTRRPTGRCTPCRKTSPSTRANMTPATSRSARPVSSGW